MTHSSLVKHYLMWVLFCCRRSGGRISSGGIKAKRESELRSAPAPAPAPSVTVVHAAAAPSTVHVVHSAPAYAPSCGKNRFALPKIEMNITQYYMNAGISTGAWIGLTALELMQAAEREKRRAAELQRQLETQRQLGKNEAEIEALQRQI